MANWKKIITSGSSVTQLDFQDSQLWSGSGGLPADVISSSAAGSSQGQYAFNGVDVSINGLGSDADATFDSLTLDAGGLKGVGAISGAAQVLANLPDDLISGSSTGTSQGQIKLNGVDKNINGLGSDADATFDSLTLDAGGLKGVGAISGAAQVSSYLPGSLISSSAAGSSQGQYAFNGVDVSINGLGSDADATFDSLTLDAGGLKGVGAISSSDQLPSGIVSGSVLSSATQGTVTLTTNGIAANVDTGLQSGDNVQFQDLTLTGDLTVTGTTTSVSTTNVEVADQFVFIASGSHGSNKDAGIIVQSGSTGDSGSALYHDKTEERWSVAKSVAKSAVGASQGSLQNVVTGDFSGATEPDDTSGSYGPGELWLDNSADGGALWIRVAD